jgi:hypothetical protein
MKAKNLKNGYLTVRIGHSTLNYPRALNSKNVQQKVIEHVQRLYQRGIDYAYVIGYPTDGDAFLGVNPKFGPHWQKDGLFPELFEQKPKNTMPTDKVAV